MEFKGLALEAGDLIVFGLQNFSFEIEAAVIDFNENRLEVMSTQLALLRHSGLFIPEEINYIRVLKKAKDAISFLTEGLFQRNSKITCTIRGKKTSGNLIAVFDGMVVVKLPNSKYLTAGVDFVRP